MKYLFSFFLLFLFQLLFAQAPEWEWANTSPILAPDSNILATTDKNGNVYTYATFTKESIVVNNITLTNNSNSRDTYFAKYNSEGEFQWVKQIGGTGSDDIYALATDSENNIYVTGLYRWYGISFGDITFEGSGFFIAKYDTEGNLIWVRNGSAMTPQKLVISDSGEIYLAGNFAHTFTYQETTLTSITDNSNPCIMKMDNSGNLIWAKTAITSPDDETEGSFTWPNIIRNMDIDSQGNIFINGIFGSDYMTFDNITLTNDYFISMFMAKFDTLGNIQWAKTAGSFGCTFENSAIATDADGNSFIGGLYCGAIDFDETQIVNGTGGSYIYKFDSSGNILWGHNIGPSLINSLVTDDMGNLYAGGAFHETLNLGTIVIDTEGGANFIAKYTSEGEIIWLKIIEGQDVNSKQSLDVSNNILYAAGYLMHESLTLDSLILTPDTNNYHLYVAKLGEETLTLTENKKNKFKVFPNPAGEQITIQSETDLKSVKITDSNGRLIKQSYNTTQINITDISSGIYFVTVENAASDILTYKIIKE